MNDFIPFTFAVWLGLLATMVVHEFGHAVLCRVEGIRVKSMGILMAVIPIGAFVEPDEEDQEKTKGLKKMRMFGAGITNNILLGLACFALVVFLLGFAVPVSHTPDSRRLCRFPGLCSRHHPQLIIKEVNGIPVSSRDEVATLLNTTKPGDTITLLTENKGTTSAYTLKLAAWPEEMSDRTSGFMGVTYYDAPAVKEQFRLFSEPIGLIILLAIPIYTITDPTSWGQFSLLTIDTRGSHHVAGPVPALLDRDPAPVLVRVVQPRGRDVQCPAAGAAGWGVYPQGRG